MKTKFFNSQFFAFIVAFLLAGAVNAQVLNGDISLFTQTQVNNFNYTEVTGHVLINGHPLFNGGNPITDLSPLESLEKVGAFFQVAFVDDPDLNFPNLTSVGENPNQFGNAFFFVGNNNVPTTISLPVFEMAWGDFYIDQNNSLTSADLPALTYVGGTSRGFTVRSNPELTYLNVPNLTTVLGRVDLSNNDKMTEISGFNNLMTVPGDFAINNNDLLTSVTGFGSLSSVGSFQLYQNPMLSDCCLFKDLIETPGAVTSGNIQIFQNATGCNSTGEIISSCVACPTSATIGADPSGDICLGTTGVQYSATVAGGAATNTYAWCAYNSGDGSGTCFDGFSDNTSPNPTRSWTSSTGPKSVGVTVSQAGCPDVTDLYSFNVVQPAAPTPDQDMKMFCWGDPNVAVGLAGTGVNVSDALTGNERIVWELVSAPANSDLNIGLLNDDCMGPATNIILDGELRIANSSKVVRVDNVSVVNNMGDPVIGDYVFNAYFKDCDLGCISLAAGPFTITVKEPFPVITCPPAITVECGASLDPADTGNPTTPTNSCCAAAPGISHSDASVLGNCPVVETITRTFTVDYTDCNYMPTCEQTITIEDTTPPLIVTCPSDQTIEWPAGFNTAPVGANTPQDPSIDPSNYNNMVYTELCGTVTIEYQDMLIGPNACPDLWVVERVWTITDECSLSSQCVQTFTFTDTTDPVITCPADPAVIEWPAGFNTAPVGANTPQDLVIAPADYGMATATDNCGDPAITYQDVIYGPVPGDCPNLWTVQRTWTATDACGLTDVCVQVFTFSDTTPPVIATCPPNHNVEGCGTADIMNGGLTNLPYNNTSTGVSPAGFAAEGGAASDNCTIVTYNYQDVASGTCPTVVTRTWTLTDYCGQTATCTQIINMDDTTPPIVACQDITVSLTANGDLNITPSQVYDAANSSDNCGTVVPVSVSPSYFSCPDEGSNIVTLTGEDACGNPATCTATVTVEPFITNIVVGKTDETCAGAGDGTITASATAGGGQVGYSIDGINFQFTNTFNNVLPGTYSVTIKVFGVAAVCEKTATVTVGAGSAPTVWYKDVDGDGYSDHVTQTSCNQPVGYKAFGDLAGPENDCDDNDVNEYPGQTWYKDSDNDTYTDGTTVVACLRPSGHKTAGELVNTTDIDCNDNDPAVNHGATEVCNGIDDDCDGQVDEDGGGGQTYNGNVVFTTQAQINAWSACYSIINGNVTIQGATITNLGPLSNITTVTGNLMILMNTALTSLNGLDNLATVGGAFYMYYNFQLSNCCAIDDLLTNNGVSGPIVIFFNKAGSHCNSAAAIMGACPIAPLVANPNGNSNGSKLAILADWNAFTLFPNPAKGQVTIGLDGFEGNLELTVVDQLGRTVWSQQVEGNQHSVQLDLSNGSFHNGIYLVTIVSEGERVTKRLVVAK